MSRHAANSAAQPNSSLNAPRVLISSFGRHNGHCSMPSSSGALPDENGLRFGRTSAAEKRRLTSVH